MENTWFPLLVGGVTISCILVIIVLVLVFVAFMLRGIHWHVKDKDQ